MQVVVEVLPRRQELQTFDPASSSFFLVTMRASIGFDLVQPQALASTLFGY
jgi:hypothetical protein